MVGSCFFISFTERLCFILWQQHTQHVQHTQHKRTRRAPPPPPATLKMMIQELVDNDIAVGVVEIG